MRYYFDHWQKYPYKFPTHLKVQKDSSKSYDSQRLDINQNSNIDFAAGYLIYVQTSNQNHIITIFERKFQYFLQKFHETPKLYKFHEVPLLYKFQYPQRQRVSNENK